MGKWVHILSEIDPETRSATCAGCGAGARIAFKSHKGRWVCMTADGRRHPRPASGRRTYDLASKYALTPDDYDALLRSQGDACAICHQPCSTGRRLAVDHDHRSGRVRGLLCGKCNRALGLFQDDSALLSAAAQYLTQ